MSMTCSARSVDKRFERRKPSFLPLDLAEQQKRDATVMDIIRHLLGARPENLPRDFKRISGRRGG